MPGVARFRLAVLVAALLAVTIEERRLDDARLDRFDDAGFAALHAAWLQHALLIFPGQHLSNAGQIAFAKRFGPIERIGGGDIVAISNVKADGTVRRAG